MDGSDYILGSDDRELRRLAAQHETWKAQAMELWDRAGFRAGMTVLDLGCGPGYTTVDLAQRVGPEGRVIAVDSAPRFLDHLARQVAARGLTNVEIREGDVQETVFPEESVDGAYARWLMCFLREPRQVIASVARALRPGAAFAVTDYFNYRAFTLAPRSAAMDRVVAAVEEAWRRRGGDLDVQGATPSLMARHGLEVTDVLPVTGLARPGSRPWTWPRSFFRDFLVTLQEMELVSAEEAAAFERDWDDRERDPGAFLYLPPILDVVGVKSGRRS